jgi:hypothetical protein
MRFVVATEIFELFPGLKLSVAVAEDVSPSADAAGVEGLWRQSWEDAARSLFPRGLSPRKRGAGIYCGTELSRLLPQPIYQITYHVGIQPYGP